MQCFRLIVRAKRRLSKTSNGTGHREAYCVNVLSPLVDIVNDFFAKEYRLKFEIQLFSEYPQKPDYTSQRDEQTLPSCPSLSLMRFDSNSPGLHDNVG